ncbi:MAG: diguanylate cyclase [Phycisphaeraceae bacterium]|nr:diguanylate cyclase [Phycisphaeraceae bacterium]
MAGEGLDFTELFDQLTDGIYMVDTERRITYWSAAAERITGFAARDVLGRRCSDNVLCHVDAQGCNLCLNKCPVSDAMHANAGRQGEVFLHHRDGHRVPVSVRVVPLRDGDGKVIGAVEAFTDRSAQPADLDRLRELENLAYLDTVTGIANHRYMKAMIESRLAEQHRFDWRFGVLVADVDHFQQINWQHGHQVGDRLLRAIARTLSHACRTFDMVGRWGGEEFLLLHANVDATSLQRVADRLRALVEQSALLVADQRVSVTISLGGAIAQQGDTPMSLVERAEIMLQNSKSAGCNRATLVA